MALRLAGGASLVRLSVPSATGVRLALDGGASAVTIGPRSWTGVAGGTVLTAPGWSSAVRR